MQAENQLISGRRNLGLGQEKLLSGPIRLIGYYKKKENISIVIDTLKSLRNLKEVYDMMLYHISTGMYKCVCMLMIVCCFYTCTWLL